MIARHQAQGVLTVALLGAAYVLCYLDRLAIASAVPFIAKDFHLSALQVGSVLSAFFAGYALMQIPGGALADRFGSRIIMTGSIAWWSLMTALTGAAQGLTSLLLLRSLFGLGEGPFPAAASKALAETLPRDMIGRASGFQYAATSIGASIAPLLVTGLVPHYGWRPIFGMLFLPGILLSGAIWLSYRDHLIAARHAQGDEQSRRAPIFRALRVPAILWCTATYFLANIAAWGLLNWLPSYLLEARHYEAHAMGVYVACTNLCGAIGYLIGGYLCDRVFQEDVRIPIALGIVLCAVFTYWAAITSNAGWSVLCLSIVFACSSAATTAMLVVPLRSTSADAVGSAFGIVNTAGQLAGVIAPLAVGGVLSVTQGSYRIVLFVMVMVTGLALLPTWWIGRLPRHFPAAAGIA